MSFKSVSFSIPTKFLVNRLYLQATLCTYYTYLPENELTQLKTKLRNVWHKYKVKVPYKYQHIIANLTNNTTIKVLKQEWEKSVVIMDSSKYKEKCRDNKMPICQSYGWSTEMYRDQNPKMCT